MVGSLLVLTALHKSSLRMLRADEIPKGSLIQAGFSAAWGDQGVSLIYDHRQRWQTGEHLMYRPDYLERPKAFVLVTDASEGKFHVSVVDRTGRALARLEIGGATAGMPAVVPCGDTLVFADPGVFARAPINGENNPGWLELRQQLNILSYSIAKGTPRWQTPELSIGQPLAATGSYLWTVRLTNPGPAYAGDKAAYEIDQVGGYSGKIVRSWPYPESGVDLTAYRWRASIKGTTCVLHRLDPWPDATVLGNTSPVDLSLAKVLTAPKAKHGLKKRGPVAAKK